MTASRQTSLPFLPVLSGYFLCEHWLKAPGRNQNRFPLEPGPMHQRLDTKSQGSVQLVVPSLITTRTDLKRGLQIALCSSTK